MPRINNTRQCEKEGCERMYHARGLCSLHYSKTDFKKESNKQYRKRNSTKVKQWKSEQAKRYRKKYPEVIRARCAKYRAQKIEGLKRFGWIDEKLIANYYTRICGICNTPIESKYEIDHIIPLSRNGTHTLDNLQLTHPICNRTKRGRLQKEMGIDIMLLEVTPELW